MLRFLQEEDWFESRLFQALGWTVLCAFMAVQVLACLEMPVGEYDDAIPLVSSKLVQLGRIPGVDFKSFYPPLYYYIVAAGFHFYGETVLIVRFLAVVLYVLVAFTTALFFRNAFPNLRPLIPFMTLPVTAAMGTFSFAAWPGYAVALLSLLVYLGGRFSSEPNARWTALSGLLAGISTLIRFNFGPYVLVAIGADIVLTEVLIKSNSPVRVRLNRALLQAAAFGVPFVLVNLIFYWAIYGGNAIAAPWQMVKFSMDAMNSGNFVRLRPALGTLLCLSAPGAWIFVRKVLPLDTLPTAAIIPAVFWGVSAGVAIFAPPTPSVALWFPVLSILSVITFHVFVFPLPQAVLCLLLLYSCFQHYFLTRADFDHVWVLYPILALTFPFLFASPTEVTDDDRQPDSILLRRGAVFLALVAAAAGIVARSKPDVNLAKNSLRMILDGGLDPRRPDRERLLLNSPELADEIQATEFVRKKTAPSDLIFVGVQRHSGSFVSDVRTYWLSERLPGVSYVHLDSGIAGKENFQQEITSELEHNGVNWAILYDASGTWGELAYENLSPGSQVLDNFLRVHFETVVQFGRYSVVKRKHYG